MRRLFLFFVCTLLLVGCGDDDGTEADKAGIGAQCVANDDCKEDGQSCLTNFKGGYCGVSACTADSDCPEASACVTHDDGVNYCFRVCADKVECNANRDADNEANCSGSATFVDDRANRKACIPPSGG